MPISIVDNIGNTHTVIEMTVANAVVGIFSKDADFVPSGAGITGFANVRPGLTLASSVDGVIPGFYGTANNATSLNGLTATSFVRNSGSTQTMSVALNVQNNTGLTVGASNDFKASVAAGVVTLQNQTQDGNIVFSVNKGGLTTTIMTLDGANGNVNFGNVLTCTDVNHSGPNAVGNVGSSTSYFNRVFATATTALYADVAERFEADDVLEAGTVVELGGEKEITRAREELSDNVFGVISTNAAYLMNGGAGEDDTHPPVAITGRVPVKCIGIIKKGDRLVSAGDGTARAAAPGEATSFNVIGRALVDKTTVGESMVEAVVMIK